MEVNRRKPFQICNSARTTALGIVAGSLRELKEIARLKFGSGVANCRVYLSDGTEIDNEEYFSSLEDQTKLVIICDGEMRRNDLLGK